MPWGDRDRLCGTKGRDHGERNLLWGAVLSRGTLKECVGEGGVAFLWAKLPGMETGIREEHRHREGNHRKGVASRVCFAEVESWLRGQIRDLLQQLLEEEVTEFLGRERSQRLSQVEGPSGYRNGYGKPRQLTLSSGTITVRRPRVRNTKEPFESRLLPLFAKRSAEVGDLLRELYLHGLSEGDFDLALRSLLGDKAPLSRAR
jgi:hypothetical protein